MPNKCHLCTKPASSADGKLVCMGAEAKVHAGANVAPEWLKVCRTCAPPGLKREGCETGLSKCAWELQHLLPTLQGSLDLALANGMCTILAERHLTKAQQNLNESPAPVKLVLQVQAVLRVMMECMAVTVNQAEENNQKRCLILTVPCARRRRRPSSW